MKKSNRSIGEQIKCYWNKVLPTKFLLIYSDVETISDGLRVIHPESIHFWMDYSHTIFFFHSRDYRLRFFSSHLSSLDFSQRMPLMHFINFQLPIFVFPRFGPSFFFHTRSRGKTVLQSDCATGDLCTSAHPKWHSAIQISQMSSVGKSSVSRTSFLI